MTISGIPTLPNPFAGIPILPSPFVSDVASTDELASLFDLPQIIQGQSHLAPYIELLAKL